MSAASPEVVVVGAGVIGLTAALELAEHGRRVVVWSRDDALQTTSAVAGAIWYPFLAEPRERVLALGAASFRRLTTLAADAATGVHIEAVMQVFTSEPDLWWRAAVPAVQRMAAADVPPPFAAAVQLQVPVCDAPQHLTWLVAQLASRGVTIERRVLRSLDEAFAVADTVVNCTGLGAAALCGDASMFAARGQVLVCDPLSTPTAWIDDTGDQPIYVIPRRGELIVGGTCQRGDARLAIDDGDTAAILAGVAHRLPQLTAAHVRSVRVGLRPGRPTIRLECIELPNARRLVHNYGHGGSGFTVAFGCAETVAAMLTAPN